MLTMVSGNNLGGNARDLARSLVARAAAVPRGAGKICLLGGGETTCVVKGEGKGGRNQEMALVAGMELSKSVRFTVACTRAPMVGEEWRDGDR